MAEDEKLSEKVTELRGEMDTKALKTVHSKMPGKVLYLENLIKVFFCILFFCFVFSFFFHIVWFCLLWFSFV